MTVSPQRLAFLANPLSGHNQRHGNTATTLASQVGLPVREASDPDDLRAALRELAEHVPDLLIINGGDGTVRVVVDALRKNRIFEKEPMLALLHGGSTNLIQKDAGLRGQPDDALKRLLVTVSEGIPEQCVRTRHPLVIRRNGDDLEEHGFFWSAGALPRIFRSTQASYAEGKPRGALGESGALLGALKTLFFGDPETNRLLYPEPIGWGTSKPSPESAAGETQRMFVFITTLDHLVLGFSPGAEGTGLKLVSLRYPYSRRNLVTYLLSRGGISASKPDGFEAATAEELWIRVGSDWALDGEFFEGDPANPLLHVKVAAPFRFLTC